ncbi:sigma 54-interacting transcriptional regulator [Clostridium polynesiense]|uniref:sigma 54-interacting transcriptional regulator n=1 Tax=Clostridium polynesiense TaxID=1325933 RepID=UPI00058D3DFC|nr:sigma 54-interacting transcriptional regulator [Clostridium polynesiense]
MFSKEVIIKDPHGLHTRIAAMIVNKASELISKYKVNLFIHKPPYKDPLGISMLALISLKVRQNESIIISCREGENGKDGVLELCSYIESHINSNTQSMKEIDAFIEETKIANEQILDNLPIGILVIDTDCNITSINKYALSFLEVKYEEVIGKPVLQFMSSSDLPEILKSGEKHYGLMHYINDKIAMVSRSPIYSGDKIIAAVAVYQDVSDLIGMKELNEKFRKLLETSHDLICFVDEYGDITYINSSYKTYFSLNYDDVVGKNLSDISPKGYRMKALKSKKKLENVLHTKYGVDIVTSVEPIFIDGNFKGVISTSKPINEIKEILSKLEKSEEELKYYKDEFIRHNQLNSSFRDIIGSSGTLKSVLSMCLKASQSTSTVLITGESGTGKELIAKAIHNNSDRKDKPFIKVNSAAIPESLLESELFGYEKGAFTGANKSKPGKFALAHGGTLFLDEIGDMPVSMQVKLLRALQEREIEALGGLKPQKIDVRVIAATNKDLEAMLREESFREDLYYRLNVLSINLPPLRRRQEDISALTEHFINKFNAKLGKSIKGIDIKSLKLLQDYSWPGNVRELENIIERALNLCEGETITEKDLPSYINSIHDHNEDLIKTVDGELLPFEEYEKAIIKAAMEKYKSYNRAGKALGLTHRTISLKCAKYNIQVNNK